MPNPFAIVAGATRGAGRGIARALGEAGYTVVCTGRSTRAEPSPYNMPETIDETAAMIPGAIARRVDHTREDEVVALFADYPDVEVVVDSVAGEDPAFGAWSSMLDTDLSRAELVLRQALVSHLYTAKYAGRALRKRKRGLLVEVVEYDLLYGAGTNLLSALVKGSLKLLAAIMAEDLRTHGVTAVSITPGFLRSESMLRHFKVTPDTWRDAGKQDPHFLHSESPLFIGRGVAALARDPNASARAGQILSSWQLSREYRFTDEDGSRPDWGAHWRDEVLPTMPAMRAGIERHVAWLGALTANAREQLGSVE
jgi:NAD(P)-dependent dehydrogenase (short-subunit alcohol dehydrogenase family)